MGKKTLIILKSSRLIFLLFLILNFSNLFAQPDTIYTDENLNKLSKSVFYEKMKSNVYEGYRHSTDSVVLESLRLKFVFGNLQPNTKSQLFKLFTVRHKIDTTKTLSIMYIDTLEYKKKFPNKNYALVLDSVGNVIGKENYRSDWIFPHSYLDVRKYKKFNGYKDVNLKFMNNYKTFIKDIKQYIKGHKKNKDVIPLIFYGFNAGTETELQDINALKDYGHLLQKLFNNRDKNPFHIIIKSDGEFYVNYTGINSYFKELFMSDVWNKRKAEFLKINN